jgi:hypothetical protein
VCIFAVAFESIKVVMDIYQILPLSKTNMAVTQAIEAALLNLVL